MKAALFGLAGILLTAGQLFAQYPPYPCMPPAGPGACVPGSYCTGPGGMAYGPAQNANPPCSPFNGILPAPPWYKPPTPAAGANLVPEFPSHPYARSPRDFYMYPQDRDQENGLPYMGR